MSSDSAGAELPLDTLRVAPWRAAICVLAVGVDLFLVTHGRDKYPLRAGVALAFLGVLLVTRASAPRHHGFRRAGFVADLRWMLCLSLIVVAAYAVAAAIAVVTLRAGWWSLPHPLPRDLADWDELGHRLPVMLLAAPLMEELLYRGLAVPALGAVAGRRGALWLSGPLFFGLHLAYGYPWWLLHYFVAGWLLALAFLRRGQLWVVVALHALGNVLMLLDDILMLAAPDFVRWLLGPASPVAL